MTIVTAGNQIETARSVLPQPAYSESVDLLGSIVSLLEQISRLRGATPAVFADAMRSCSIDLYVAGNPASKAISNGSDWYTNDFQRAFTLYFVGSTLERAGEVDQLATENMPFLLSKDNWDLPGSAFAGKNRGDNPFIPGQLWHAIINREETRLPELLKGIDITREELFDHLRPGRPVERPAK